MGLLTTPPVLPEPPAAPLPPSPVVPVPPLPPAPPWLVAVPVPLVLAVPVPLVLELLALANEVSTTPDAVAAVVDTPPLVVDPDPLAVDMAPAVADAPELVVVVAALVSDAVPLAAGPFELSDSAEVEQAGCRQLSNPSQSTSDTDRFFTVLPAATRMAPGKPLAVKGINFCLPRRKPRVQWRDRRAQHFDEVLV